MSWEDDLSQWARAQVAELRQAKVGALVVVALGMWAGWLIRGWLDAREIAVMERQIAAGAAGLPAPAEVVASSPPILLFPYLPLWLGGLGGVAVIALLALGWRNSRRLKKVNEALRTKSELLDDSTRDRERLTTQRDEAVAALRDKRNEYANKVLERYSRARFSGDFQPTVTIRHASYVKKDYELVEQIETIFKARVGWPVDIDATNNPALPRAGEFKVVFDVGMTLLTYGELVGAFSDSDLIGVPVGQTVFSDRKDTHRLIVLVLPSGD